MHWTWDKEVRLRKLKLSRRRESGSRRGVQEIRGFGSVGREGKARLEELK